MRSLWIAVGMVVLLSLGSATDSWADRVDEHVEQLEHGRHYKLRLSAALVLGKSEDARAIAALTRLLESDGSKTMRRVAALSLGGMVTPQTPRAVREDAERALTQAAKRDRDRKVRRHAEASLRALREVVARPGGGKPLRPVAPDKRVERDPPKLRAGGVYLHVTTRRRDRRSPRGLPEELREVVRAALRDSAPEYRTEWPTRRPPSAEELARAAMHAYRVQPAVMGYRVRKRGAAAEVECTVSVQVNAWDGRGEAERWSEKQSAAATGRGRVSGRNQRASIAAAQRECVQAVAERITGEQVVPFLRRLEAGRK
ncbi:HEAT repeat domain-containing protein [Haliangium ochraceum]|uniref:PBS lyase HEAT domain protein repeat-containing protein n=1 Tax=Haliangium ochraceum (strain DSM 14365 / JCM 11303 / SMP-2) TaxID=502025 RepID=D0LG27_HALO1|nr:HEAT repeat domain-containing protein [Haliangium ochraceum]ACY14629.1 hypothetical protein Hoch_2084 [Haliangium ochraceum DSM 14365]